MKTNDEILLKKQIDNLREYRKEEVSHCWKMGPLLGLLAFLILFFALGFATKNWFMAIKIGAVVGVGVIPFVGLAGMFFSWIDLQVEIIRLKKQS